MTSRLSTKLFAVARIVGRRAMAALSKNGKEVIKSPDGKGIHVALPVSGSHDP